MSFSNKWVGRNSAVRRDVAAWLADDQNPQLGRAKALIDAELSEMADAEGVSVTTHGHHYPADSDPKVSKRQISIVIELVELSE